MRIKYIVLLLSITLFNQSFALVSVGTSPGSGICDYTTIQQALNSSATEINVLNNQNFVENLLIDHEVEIVGGFASCQDANSSLPPTDTNTKIKGNDTLGQSVIRIETNEYPIIKLINLTLQSAVQDDSVQNGGHGIKIDESNGVIWLIDSSIGLNNSDLGAGIYMKNTHDSIFDDLSVKIVNSSVLFNTANSNGGGIFCSGQGARLTVYDGSFIGANTAVNGGGIYAESDCFVTMTSGVNVHTSSEFRGLMYNNASGDGGGVYADSAIIGLNPTLSINGEIRIIDTPVTLAKNTAGNDGGGIYAINGSVVNILDALVEGNTAGNKGGGFYTESESEIEYNLITMSLTKRACWNQGACLEVSNNKAHLGGVVYFKGTSKFYISNATVRDNRADVGTVAYGESAFIDITGNYVYNNGNNGEGGYNDNYVLHLINNATLRLRFSTLTDNDINASSAIIGGDQSNLGLRDSIIHNAETVLEDDDSIEVAASCLLVNENESISEPNIYVQNPGFVDANNQNYHIHSNSNAIDLCQSSLSSYGYDSDGNPRAWDEPFVENVEGSLDAGADEYFVDLIFKNSFE